MRRIVGIIMFVFGVLLLVGGIMRLLPTGNVWSGMGFFAIIIGVVVFGLSFVRPHQPAPDARRRSRPPTESPGSFTTRRECLRTCGITRAGSRAFSSSRSAWCSTTSPLRSA